MSLSFNSSVFFVLLRLIEACALQGTNIEEKIFCVKMDNLQKCFFESDICTCIFMADLHKKILAFRQSWLPSHLSWIKIFNMAEIENKKLT